MRWRGVSSGRRRSSCSSFFQWIICFQNWLFVIVILFDKLPLILRYGIIKTSDTSAAWLFPFVFLITDGKLSIQCWKWINKRSVLFIEPRLLYQEWVVWLIDLFCQHVKCWLGSVEYPIGHGATTIPLYSIVLIIHTKSGKLYYWVIYYM